MIDLLLNFSEIILKKGDLNHKSWSSKHFSVPAAAQIFCFLLFLG
ncbi:hypothetical protein SynA1524_02080 [Synechococcus sp. A15-24]|nr:hypothetical protein SynA1524_02080 [Synechococcus sp. A15-24]